MNEADRRILDLIGWLKTATEKPSINIWSELEKMAPIDKKAAARRERNARYYQGRKSKDSSLSKPVLKRLKNRLKASETSEIVLIDGVPRMHVKASDELWFEIRDDRISRGLKAHPIDGQGGWYVKVEEIERAMKLCGGRAIKNA